METKDPLKDGLRRQLSDAFRRVEELLGSVGTAGVRERIAELRQVLIEQRAPRLALIGRRGSGKSSLLNAIFGEKLAEVGHERAQTGEAGWFEYRGARGTMDVLDTRGFQEGSAPQAPDSAPTAVESIRRALRVKLPDAMIFVVRTSDVDSAIDEDLRLLSQIVEEADARHGGRMRVLAIVTHCDQVEPKNIRLHDPSDDAPNDIVEKLARVENIKRHLEQKILAVPELRDRLVSVLGVSSYQSWREEGCMRADERWGIDHVVSFLFDELPREARVEFARLAKVRKFQRDIAETLTITVAGACAALAAAPLPVADIVSITSAQTTLVLAIGYVSGRNLSVGLAAEFLAAMGANVGAAFGFREVARAIAKLVAPMAAAVASSTIAYAGTVMIGKAATAHFIDGVSAEVAKGIFARSSAQGAKREEMDRERAD
jgi:predicted GTPase